MLTIYRRHRKKCVHRNEGRKYRRCRCPITIDGFLSGQEIRKALDTCDWEKANKIVHDLESAAELADVRRTWAKDPVVLMETKGTQKVHGNQNAVN